MRNTEYKATEADDLILKRLNLDRLFYLVIFQHCYNVYCALRMSYNLQLDGLLDGWRTCDFTSFSTVFKPYHDDGWVIMKSCVPWNPVYD